MTEDAIELRKHNTLFRKATPEVSWQLLGSPIDQCEVSRCSSEYLLFRRVTVPIQLDDAIEELVMIDVVKESGRNEPSGCGGTAERSLDGPASSRPGRA